MNFHRDLFENWSVSDLRTLAAYAYVDLSSAVDRKSMSALLRCCILNRPHLERYAAAYEKLIPMTIHELYALAREWNVSVSHCVDSKSYRIRLISVVTKTQICI
jgi:hypothetical protein